MKITQLKSGLFPKYRLDEDYKFSFLAGHKKVGFIIPKGFEYDGATFGSFLFWRRSAHEKDFTIAHDWVYFNLGDVAAFYDDGSGDLFGVLKKNTSDDFFLRGLREDLNVQPWRDRVASGAFKTFGWLLWKKRYLFKKVLKK